jgi:D-lactate dehydrogenase (cytochrome)
VKDILNSGVMIQCVELCDDEFMRATNVYGVSEKKYPELDSLFFKFQGTPELIKETSRVVKDIVFKHGGTGFQMAKTPKQADDLWADRKNALYSSLALVPGARGWSTDVCGTLLSFHPRR